MSLPRTLIIAFALVSGLPGQARSPKAKPEPVETRLRSRLPLGAEGFFLRPARRTLYIMSSADSPAFEGWRVLTNGPHRTVFDRNGEPVLYYPQQLHFRVTASTVLELLGVQSSPLELETDTDDFLRHLGFRLKIFHELQMTMLKPDSIQMLGVPLDVSSEERVYGAAFSLPRVPIDDHIVLEVLTPGGDQLCRFHLAF